MHGVLPAAAAVARGASPTSGPHENVTPASGCEERDWFYEAACAICGVKDPGYQLHLFTGWPKSSCRYFVARDPAQRRKVPSEFLRDLFRSQHGEPFFRAFMHGCDARWFAELVQSEQRARAAEGKLAAISEIAG